MEQTPPTPQPTETPQPSSSSLPTPSAIPPPSSTISSSPNPIPIPNPNQNPNQNPNPKPLTPLQSHHQQQQQQQQQQHQSLQNSQTRPPFNRTWQPQSSHFPHFSSHLHSLPSSSASSAASSSSSASSSISVPPAQRGGIAIGVPAHHPSPPPPQSAPFSSSFGQQFGGLGRNAVSVPESVANPSTSQTRQPIQGYQGMGMMGSLGSASQMRPGGISSHHQQRPVQPSLRPQSSPNSSSIATQNFQGHGLLRGSSVGSPGSPSPNSSQNMQSHNQPWLSSASQGKPPLPSPSFRPQMNPQSLQQRSHIPQQHHHPLPATSQPQQMSSAQQPQQPLPSHQQQEHHGQQFPPSRVPQSLAHQQQISRVQGLGNQKPSSLVMAQPSTVQSGPQNRTASADSGESGNRILSKRSIHELVNQIRVGALAVSSKRFGQAVAIVCNFLIQGRNQEFLLGGAKIDPSERLDPEVEDILVDIADEFVDSITTFGCSLAKHRKSNTLEAKDILLHLERNWNMTLPGFGGDEIKGYKKPIANDIHRERLAVIKKSTVGTETTNTRSSAGQASGNAKGHMAKAPANAMESPNPKIREVA